MKKSSFFRGTIIVFALALIFSAPCFALASTEENVTLTSVEDAKVTKDAANSATEEDVTVASVEDVGVTKDAANSATEEATSEVKESGMLIEIGNTTAEETTIIIRVGSEDAIKDKTVVINNDTAIFTRASRSADLSDWIAGDHISYTAEVSENSDELVATELRNMSFYPYHRGKNGWIKDINIEANTMDVEWANQIFTLDTSEARMVAGLKNPADLADFKVGDRIRARVTDDGDQDPATWKAQIIVVLRRGNTLFMRVTRWVVPAEIVNIPENTATLPYVITAKVLPSKFYQKGDVNNLIGAPGEEFSIEVNETTKLVRHYLGRATIGEFMEGDVIRVIGRLNDETGNLDAEVIKNEAIQMLGVSNRISEVTEINIDENKLTVVPIGVKNPITGKRHRIANGQSWTIRLKDGAKIYKNGEEISFSDIEVGDIIRLRGTANLIRKTVDSGAISVVTDRFNRLLE